LIDESKILMLFMVGITVGLLTSSRPAVRIRSGIFPKYLWIVMSISSILMIYTISVGNLAVFNILNVLIGLCTGGIMATFLINSQNAISSQDRTVLSGLIQLGRYFGATVGVTVFTGMLPEVSMINNINQFVGAFALLVVLSISGLVNELI